MTTSTFVATLGPFALPLSEADADRTVAFIQQATIRGYAILRAERDGVLTLTATRTITPTQPFARRTYHERFTSTY
jgi:hypothetical protein